MDTLLKEKKITILKYGNNMKILFLLNKELTTHIEAQLPLIKELKKQCNLELLYYKYGEEESIAKSRINDNSINIYMSDVISPFSKIYKDLNRPFVFVPHGISAFKPFRPTKNCRHVNSYIFPSQVWVEQFLTNDIKNNIKDSRLENSYGWSKMDIYYNKIQNKEKIRNKIYKKYNLNSKKPLVVYAPTGIRQNAGTLEKWKKEYKSQSGYIMHGAYYLKDKIRKQINKTDVNLIELPHPCIKRGDIDNDRIDVMVASDMLISDISSMAIEYLAIDKPIILLQRDIPDRTPLDFKLFSEINKETINIGDIISYKELAETIEYRLQNDDFKIAREYWKEKLIGKFDGKASIRAAKLIIETK